MKLATRCPALIALLIATPASAADLKDMIGTWTWQRFTIEVKDCADKGVCSKVIAGPKNVGLEIFASELVAKDGGFVGQIVDPQTGATYFTRMHLTKEGSWRLDGCTASKVCLSGEFVKARQ